MGNLTRIAKLFQDFLIPRRVGGKVHLLLEVDWVTRLGSVVLFEDFPLIRTWWVGGGWKVVGALCPVKGGLGG